MCQVLRVSNGWNMLSLTFFMVIAVFEDVKKSYMWTNIDMGYGFQNLLTSQIYEK